MKVHESGENYLEAILVLNKEKGYCRAIDIAHYLEYSKPTVSVMLKNLKEGGYVVVDDDGHIKLTDAGREIADDIYEKHVIIAKFFMKLGVNEKTAFEDSCKIEHDISDESFSKIKDFLK